MATSITLQVFRGEELLRTERFSREIIKVGRLPTAHLSIDDDRLSRIHAVVEVSPEGAVSIIDMGSAEGTYVNGRRVGRSPIRPGDDVRLGGIRLALGGGDGAPAPAPLAAPAPAATPAAAAPRSPAAPRAEAQRPAAATAAPSTRPSAAAAAPAPAPGGAVATPAAAAPAPAVAARGPAGAARGAPTGPLRSGSRPRSASRSRRGRRRWTLARASGAIEDLSNVEVEVELRLSWGGTLLDSGAFAAPRAAVFIGDDPSCALRVPARLLPVARLPVLRREGSEHLFGFLAGAAGVLEEPAGRTPLAALVAAGRATPDRSVPGLHWVPVPRRGALRAELGHGLSLEARARRPERVHPPPIWERINYQFLNLFLVLFFLQAGFVIAARNFPYDTDVVADDLFKNPSRMAKFIIRPPEARRPVEKLPGGRERRDAQAGEQAEKHRGDEGQMGKRGAAKTGGRSAPKAIDPDAREVVKQMGVLGALGRGGGGLATVMGTGGLGGDVRGAVGNLFGATVGDSLGFGGLGVRGTGAGGGGTGETIGIGAIGTKGRGGGLGGYGQGVGQLGRKADREIAISTGAAQVMGSIDKELIRRVIHEHASQIRFCYEEQLAVHPRIAGKVVIRWVIDADGNASSAQVDAGATTLADEKVQQCMMARIVSWQFPKPKGGGIAVVTYPWILRAAGAE